MQLKGSSRFSSAARIEDAEKISAAQASAVNEGPVLPQTEEWRAERVRIVMDTLDDHLQAAQRAASVNNYPWECVLLLVSDVVPVVQGRLTRDNLPSPVYRAFWDSLVQRGLKPHISDRGHPPAICVLIKPSRKEHHSDFLKYCDLREIRKRIEQPPADPFTENVITLRKQGLSRAGVAARLSLSPYLLEKRLREQGTHLQKLDLFITQQAIMDTNGLIEGVLEKLQGQMPPGAPQRWQAGADWLENDEQRGKFAADCRAVFAGMEAGDDLRAIEKRLHLGRAYLHRLYELILPDFLLKQGQTAQAVLGLMSPPAVSGPERRVFELLAVRGLDRTQIAERAGMTLQMVKKRCTMLRRKFPVLGKMISRRRFSAEGRNKLAARRAGKTAAVETARSWIKENAPREIRGALWLHCRHNRGHCLALAQKIVARYPSFRNAAASARISREYSAPVKRAFCSHPIFYMRPTRAAALLKKISCQVKKTSRELGIPRALHGELFRRVATFSHLEVTGREVRVDAARVRETIAKIDANRRGALAEFENQSVPMDLRRILVRKFMRVRVIEAVHVRARVAAAVGEYEGLRSSLEQQGHLPLLVRYVACGAMRFHRPSASMPGYLNRLLAAAHRRACARISLTAVSLGFADEEQFMARLKEQRQAIAGEKGALLSHFVRLTTAMGWDSQSNPVALQCIMQCLEKTPLNVLGRNPLRDFCEYLSLMLMLSRYSYNRGIRNIF